MFIPLGNSSPSLDSDKTLPPQLLFWGFSQAVPQATVVMDSHWATNVSALRPSDRQCCWGHQGSARDQPCTDSLAISLPTL